jgi:hypothetical protein
MSSGRWNFLCEWAAARSQPIARYVTRWMRLLGVGLLAGCGADALIDLVNDIGNGSTTEKDLVVQCARKDFEILKPFVLSLLDAARGDEPGPVDVSVALPSGATMDIEFTGMDGSGLDVGVPLPVGFTCAITTAGIQGAPQIGAVTVTLQADGMLRVAGTVGIEEKCQLFVLDDLDLTVDPDILPVFRPTGGSDVQAIADALLVVFSGTVTFDGTGRAIVDAVVTSASGPTPVDFAFLLN